MDQGDIPYCITPYSATSLQHNFSEGIVVQRLSTGVFVRGGESLPLHHLLVYISLWHVVGDFFCLSFVCLDGWFDFVFSLQSLNSVYLDSQVFGMLTLLNLSSIALWRKSKKLMDAQLLAGVGPLHPKIPSLKSSSTAGTEGNKSIKCY